MTTYTVDGKGHRVLRELARRAAPFAELVDVLGITHRANLRRKTWYLAQKMRDQGFISLSCSEYAITSRGLDALARLDAGEAVAVDEVARPNVRIFPARAA